MKAERAAAEARRARTSDSLRDVWRDMEARGWTPETDKTRTAWLRDGTEPPRYTGTDTIIAKGGAPKQTKSFLERVNGAVKDLSMKIGGPVSGATAEQQAVIRAYAEANNLEIGIRATDRLTAAGTRLGVKLGLAAKPEAVKAKSILGIVFGETWWKPSTWLRSDLDLAYIRGGKGNFFTNDEILAHADALNTRLMLAGDKNPSFMHGAHFTMGADSGGYLSNAKIAKIGDAGPVNVFTGQGMTTRLAGDAGLVAASAGDGRRAVRGFMSKPIDDPWYYEPNPVAFDGGGGHGGGGGDGGGDGGGGGLLDELKAHARSLRTDMTADCSPSGRCAWAAEIGQLHAREILQGAPNTSIHQISFPSSHQILIGRAEGSWFVQDPTFTQFTTMSGQGELSLPPNPFFQNLVARDASFAAIQRDGIAFFESRTQVTEVLRAYMRGFDVEASPQIMFNSADYRGDLAEGLLPSRAQWLTHPFNPRSPTYGEAMLVAGPATGTAAPGATAALVVGTAVRLADAALGRWLATDPSIRYLQLDVSIADLPAGELGRAYITQLDAAGRPSEGRIVLDWNGDGHGWFVDPTPLDASEFADPTSAAFGRYDLFSVLAHEIGHVLGFLRGYDGYDRTSSRTPTARSASCRQPSPRASPRTAATSPTCRTDLMADRLGLFQRKLPSALAAAIIRAAQGSASRSTPPPVGGAALGGGRGRQRRLRRRDPVRGRLRLADPGRRGVEDGQGVLAETPTLAARFLQQLFVPSRCPGPRLHARQRPLRRAGGRTAGRLRGGAARARVHGAGRRCGRARRHRLAAEPAGRRHRPRCRQRAARGPGQRCEAGQDRPHGPGPGPGDGALLRPHRLRRARQHGRESTMCSSSSTGPRWRRPTPSGRPWTPQ